MPPTPTDAPLFGWRGLALAAVLSLVLCWPMLLTGQLFVFPDTSSYVRGGAVIWEVLRDIVGEVFADAPASPGEGEGEGGGNTPTGLTVNDRGSPVVGRSFTYSAAAYLAQAAGGPLAIAWLQGVVILLMVFALIGREALARPVLLAAGFAVLALLTAWPWYTVYLMPDGFAAVVVIYAMLVAGRFQALGWRQIAVATGLAAFAVSTHYGYMPLSVVAIGAALCWRLLAGGLRATTVAVALVPVLAAPLANLGASAAVLEEASVTPRRLPILLARSIQDGPAQWYLEDVCPEADLTFCRAFGKDVPTDIRAFLWDEGGVSSLTPEQMNGIRAEEAEILMRAFLAYPVEQTASLLGNLARQTVMVGTGNIAVTDGMTEGWAWTQAEPETLGRFLLRQADPVVSASVLIGAALLLVVLLSGRLDRSQRGMIVALAAGYLGNAAIFGGLSAPVDRYQARIAWLVPLLALVLFCTLAGARRRGAD
ncbi:hypothetical protein OB2597_03973 [Pseudooceanicola batsensis HTCC2597]|uniref:Glycosyltransferase RgtA/B/C/D-like domain-containing protein n=1 Tax=Pseudooceanicola batsensis (strain ATCC BAA-863 / DSM 15984 / KCTC 12145 / HTCC2597) TaxID=252305 RepID=A3U2J1_PSEBH|nr:hypothetical protein [Pseudooceanicola batsensis]EAQ01565.1 hypothetical protein OB2597_03973 [Pseudooceanicola batsensis HTCC2597]